MAEVAHKNSGSERDPIEDMRDVVHVTKILSDNPDIRRSPHVVDIVIRMLSKKEGYPIDEMIDGGLIPFLVQGLNIHDEKIVHPCVTALTNIILGLPEHTVRVVESGAAAPLIRLMTHANFKLAEEATKAVSEIARTSPKLCGVVIRVKREVAKEMKKMNEPEKNVDEICQEALGILNKNPSVKQSRHAMKSIHRMFSKGGENSKELVRDSGILPLVFQHLNDDDDELVKLALSVFDNFSRTDTRVRSRVHSVIELGLMEVLPGIMEKYEKNPEIITKCCQLIMNMTTGIVYNKQPVISSRLIKRILSIMQTGDSVCQKGCSLALFFLALWGTKAHVLSLLDQNPMPALAAVLMHTGPPETLFHPAARKVYVIYKLFSTANSSRLDALKREAVEAGVLGHLKNLQNHMHEGVCTLADKILSEYFVENDDEEAREKPKKKEEENNENEVQKRKRSVAIDEEAEDGDSTVENPSGMKKRKGSSDEKKKEKKMKK